MLTILDVRWFLTVAKCFSDFSKKIWVTASSHFTIMQNHATVDLVLRLILISPWFTNSLLFNIQNDTAAYAKALDTSFELVIYGGVKFKIVKLLTVAPDIKDHGKPWTTMVPTIKKITEKHGLPLISPFLETEILEKLLVFLLSNTACYWFEVVGVCQEATKRFNNLIFPL